MIRIAPSLLASDVLNIEDNVRACENAGAEVLHIDVMDGHFVPPITFGPSFVERLSTVTSMILDVHLMVTNPDHQVEQFADAGAQWISVHAEVTPHLHRTLQRIKQRGCKAGIVLNPVTPLDFAFEAAAEADFILLMSVNPGYGGQDFISSFLTRCQRLRSWLNDNALNHVDIEVDGGIKISNAKDAVDAGANILVSGSGLFSGDLQANIRAMKDAISGQ